MSKTAVEIVRELASSDPIIDEEWGVQCYYCGASWDYFKDEARHTSHCLWRQAVECVEEMAHHD